LVDHPSYTLVRMLREGKAAGSKPAMTTTEPPVFC